MWASKDALRARWSSLGAGDKSDRAFVCLLAAGHDTLKGSLKHDKCRYVTDPGRQRRKLPPAGKSPALLLLQLIPHGIIPRADNTIKRMSRFKLCDYPNSSRCAFVYIAGADATSPFDSLSPCDVCSTGAGIGGDFSALFCDIAPPPQVATSSAALCSGCATPDEPG